MNQRKISFGKPGISDKEKQAVLEVLGTDVLTHGPKCKEFEGGFSKFTGGGEAISVSSGMAALHLSYFQMGIGSGDEVIVPAMTHTATVHAVELMGAKPVFVDCVLETGNIDPEGIKKAISPKTKAIGLVHYLGIPCDMDAIMGLAAANSVKVIEDCALAVGSRYKGKHVGLFGESGCFSFYPVKQMTTGEGGMFITQHPDVAARVQKARAFGVDRSFSERSKPGLYDVLSLGLNYRMSDINAALGVIQISRIKDFLDRRKSNFSALKQILKNQSDILVLDSPSSDYENSHYCLSVLLQGGLSQKRAEVVSKLKEVGVGTSVYYPQPVPRFTYYQKKYGFDSSLYPHATQIADQSIAFPVGPHLNEPDMDYIGENFQRIIQEVSR